MFIIVKPKFHLMETNNNLYFLSIKCISNCNISLLIILTPCHTFENNMTLQQDFIDSKCCKVVVELVNISVNATWKFIPAFSFRIINGEVWYREHSNFVQFCR